MGQFESERWVSLNQRKWVSLRRIFQQAQEEQQKLSSFISKHNIAMTDSIKKEMQELQDQIKYYESKSIIGTNR